jgi:hypothetical protein
VIAANAISSTSLNLVAGIRCQMATHSFDCW